MKNTITHFFITALFLSMPCEIMAETEWPSTTLKEEQFKSYKRESFDQLQAAVKSQPQPGLVSFVWILATQASPVDNRAYLAALAIDLYNSIPPDLMPPPITQEQMDSEEEIDPIAFEPYKRQLNGSFLGLRPGGVPLENRESSWNAIPRYTPERQAITVELIYLFEYLREQIANGNIIIDNYDAPASLDASNIDVRNPTYYKTIRDYMEKMKPAMEARISPWEAERYIATQGSEQTKPNTNTTTTAIQTTDVPNTTAEQTPILKQIILNNLSRWEWQALIVGLALVAVGALYLRRKK